MRRDILDSMSSSGLDEFLTACANLKNCKYVLAENRIAALLKTIADNRQLYSMFSAALYGFDYHQTFSESIVGRSFVLPSEPKTAAALVFRILLSIDSGVMPLQKFLQAYFSGDARNEAYAINESFARFTLEIVTPFETYCKMLYAQMLSSPTGVFGEDTLAQNYELDNSKFNEELKADALNALVTLADIAEQTIGNIVDRDEFIECVSGLQRALRADDGDNIVSSFFGVKFAVAYFFGSSESVSAIFKKIEYDITHLSK